MESEYRAYLAASILSEERLITYRLLSRALKVHVNTAKEMLFEFHRQENGKKPGTVYATYLVAGTRHRQMNIATNRSSRKDGEDDFMQSSPFRSSPPHPTEEEVEDCPTLSIALVGEENLEELQSRYEVITSLHVYSLASCLLKDLQVLSDVPREITELQLNQDHLESGVVHGAIINRSARRRPGHSAFAAPESANESLSGHPTGSTSRQGNLNEVKKSSVGKKTELNSKPEIELSQSSGELAKKIAGERKNTLGNLAYLKRDSSSIFKSFAKAKPKLNREGTDSSAGVCGADSATHSGPEDESMKDASEDEEETYVPPLQTNVKDLGGADRTGRKEREAALRKMMDDDDQDPQPGEVLENADALPFVTEHTEGQPTEEAIRIANGRRRGRRRVVKKKTIKDEEGYLVTKEEPAWESFSEDEPLKPKAQGSSSLPLGSEKMKKGTAKPGQGSIMSFFGKK